jgi:DNA-binding transcriptional ArsR family regulator
MSKSQLLPVRDDDLACCSPLTREPMDADRAALVAGLLKALADPHRRQTVDLLGRRPHSAGELASALELSAPLMSRHLRALRQGGLVEGAISEHDARVRVYRLRPKGLSALRVWLQGLDAHWGVQLEAFKAHVERQTPRGKR